METFQFDERGYFWWSDEKVPDGRTVPANGSYGRLTVNDVGAINLELEGSLSPNQHPLKTIFGNQRKTDRQISGTIRGKNESIFLDEIWGNGGAVSSSGLSHERYLANICLVGDIMLSGKLKLPRIRRLTVPMTGFEEWLRLGSISGKRTKTLIEIKYRKQRNLKFAQDDGTLEFDFDVRGPHVGKVRGDRVTLKEEVSMLYSFKPAVSVDAAIKKFGWFADLIILLTNSEYSLDWPVVNASIKSVGATVYFPRGKRVTKQVPWNECWTSFPLLKANFADILTNWNSKRDTIGPGFYFYLGTRRGVDLYAEHKFVSLVFGLEAFHRALKPDPPDSKLDAKIDLIVGQIEHEKDKKWLRNRLKNLGALSLQQRIFEMLNSLPLGIEAKRLQAFSEQCAKFRNDISHKGRLEHSVSHYQQLRNLTEISSALDSLYHARILFEIGVTNEVIQHVFRNSTHSFRIKYHLWRVGLTDAEPGFEQFVEPDND